MTSAEQKKKLLWGNKGAALPIGNKVCLHQIEDLSPIYTAHQLPFNMHLGNGEVLLMRHPEGSLRSRM